MRNAGKQRINPKKLDNFLLPTIVGILYLMIAIGLILALWMGRLLSGKPLEIEMNADLITAGIYLAVAGLCLITLLKENNSIISEKKI